MDWSPEGLEELADHVEERPEDAARVIRHYADVLRVPRGDNVYRPTS